MTVVERNDSIAKGYIGAAADVKPTGVPVGSQFLEYDTDKRFITYDGTNWVQIDTIVQLGAGSASIGTVSVASQGYSAAVSVTRPNDTNAYTAGDVIGAATGSTAALTFPNMGPSAAEIMITSAALEVDVSAIPSGMTSFDLYLYNVTPPSALGDNAAFDLPSGDRASFLGKISLGTPVDLGSTLYVETNQINKQIKLAGTSLFGYLVTVGAYTPTAQAVKTITLHSVAV